MIAAPQGIKVSSILTVESYLNSLNQELKELGKNGAAELVYKASRDGNNSETLWAKCKNHKETITLVKTNLNSVIGFFCPDKWEDTTDLENSNCNLRSKDIMSGKPFLFYFLDD